MANHNFINRLNRVNNVVSRLPNRAAVVAVNFSKERFVRKNWVDNSREAWPKRRAGRKGRGSLMVRTGRLKRSIRKLQVTNNHILIGTDVPYAQLHNEGGTINKTVTVREHQRRIARGRKGGRATVKSHKRKMDLTVPKRQFIGESAILSRRIERMIEKELKNALR
ncbi:phage virion morphogenesis protein [Flagellimonas onchidii]|uniref:phage virion morphogenesis protein n=1 Tax=Flagellimonas onchidii TaxID=2562684 RepID=UPI0010A62208|nr:phage virion morphogenesis protein [Allomuricauda onchidii]